MKKSSVFVARFSLPHDQTVSDAKDEATTSEAFSLDSVNSVTAAEVPGDGLMYPDPTLTGGYDCI